MHKYPAWRTDRQDSDWVPVQPTSRKALDNRALTRYARRVPVGWRWGPVADQMEC